MLDIGATADLDVATTDMLAALHAELAGRGVDSGWRRCADRSATGCGGPGLMTTIGEDHCYLSVEAAVEGPRPRRWSAAAEAEPV